MFFCYLFSGGENITALKYNLDIFSLDCIFATVYATAFFILQLQILNAEYNKLIIYYIYYWLCILLWMNHPSMHLVLKMI